MTKQAATQGYSLARIQSKNTTNATLVKGGPATIYGYSLHNNAASAVYVKVYNKVTAPVPGTDTPFFTISLPANGFATFPMPDGLPLDRGFGYSVSTGSPDSDSGACAASDTVTGFILYV